MRAPGFVASCRALKVSPHVAQNELALPIRYGLCPTYERFRCEIGGLATIGDRLSLVKI